MRAKTSRGISGRPIGPARVACATVLLAAGVATTVGPAWAQTPECPDFDPGLGIVWGMVRAAEGGAPVPGAAIRVWWAGGETRAQSLRNGLFVVCGVRPGVAATVAARLDPFVGAKVDIELERGETLRVPLSIAFAGDRGAAVTGRVIGTIVDRTTLDPVSNALVTVGEHPFRGISDGGGRFTLDDVRAGSRTLRVQHVAYGDTEARFLMPDDGTLEVQVRLDPAVLPVEPIEVVIVGVRSHRLEMAGFFDRRDWNERLGLGHYVTRADVEARGPARVSHMLAEIPRLDIVRANCFSARCGFPVMAASSATCGQLRQVGGEYVIGASVYIDGRRMRVATGGAVTGVDDFVMPGDVAGIEVYTGVGDLPGEFADVNAQRCGAVVIWTGR